MKKILFQGDSITDCARNREDDRFMGRGYATNVAQSLGFDYPGEYEFVNKGISGNRIVDLYARMKIDLINLKPDYMSVLIGINDVWHEIARENGVAAEKFEKIYDMLISEVLEELPNIKIMILEPYVLKGTATEENWETFYEETLKRAAAAKRIAEKYNLKFIPLQDKFDEKCKLAPADYWVGDGVHPANPGHELIAREWMKAFEEIK